MWHPAQASSEPWVLLRSFISTSLGYLPQSTARPFVIYSTTVTVNYGGQPDDCPSGPPTGPTTGPGP